MWYHSELELLWLALLLCGSATLRLRPSSLGFATIDPLSCFITTIRTVRTVLILIRSAVPLVGSSALRLPFVQSRLFSFAALSRPRLYRCPVIIHPSVSLSKNHPIYAAIHMQPTCPALFTSPFICNPYGFKPLYRAHSLQPLPNLRHHTYSADVSISLHSKHR